MLDLFCGAGGAAMGYHRAGFDIVGVDNRPQPRYPFPFIQADAMTFPLDGYDAIHASPPCQAYSESTAKFRAEGVVYPDLIAATRDRLDATGLPWVIENVPGAPMRADYVLCGSMFGLLGLIRHRWFETSWRGFAMALACRHDFRAVTVVGHGPNSHSWWYRSLDGRSRWNADCRRAMGIEWMNRGELSQAIPPAYTEWIGTQLLAAIQNA
jgi:DNA (cytosine-5)-methyltransferase 1